ncbi:MAG: DUF4321 domain-containing protein [Candidatus Marinimicrobia bacterium]|nr:DUF4321 domain-containing protein [Candidatus Neomarinimicrobiota bacterium]
MITDYQKRSLGLLFLTLILGAALGGVLGDLLALTFPEGVVKQFFLQSVNWGISPFTVDLMVVSFTFGMRLKFSVSSIIGLGVVYYFLRYFR